MSARCLVPSLALTLLSAGTAWSDITPAEVWTSWQALVRESGQRIEVASVEDSGDMIVLEGLTLTGGDAQTEITVAVPQVVLRDGGDGAVEIDNSADYLIRISGRPDGSETVEMTLTLSQSAPSLRASGTPDAIDYSYAAEEARLETTSFVEAEKPVDLDLTIAMSTVTIETRTSEQGGLQVIDQSFAAGAMAIAADGVEPENGGDIEVAITVEGLRATSAGSLLMTAAGRNLPALLREGRGIAGTISTEGSRTRVVTTTPEGASVAESSAGPGSARFGLDADGLRYGGSSQDMAISVTPPGGMMPPLLVSVAKGDFDLRLPVLAGHAAQPFGLTLGLRGVEVPEALWSLIDLSGVLPRTPATLELGLSGLAQLGIDIFAPEAISDAVGSGDAGDSTLEEIALDRVYIDLAGATLSGEGQIDVDNSGETPVPSGLLNLSLTGANALLDNLVTLGVVPPDQATGARLMLALFAVPGPGEDELTSTIELKSDGSVTANGQRVR